MKYFADQTLILFYCLLGPLGVGTLAHFLIHRTLSEKSWATLSALITAIALVSALFLTSIFAVSPEAVEYYPSSFMRSMVIICPIFLVIGSFGLYFLLCVFSLSLLYGLYPTAKRIIEQGA